jgi:hypothetical protein
LDKKPQLTPVARRRVSEAFIGEPANDTLPRIAEMIKAGAFDRRAGK